MAQGNDFLQKRNIRSKIISASAILCQQPEINFSVIRSCGNDDPTVFAFPTAHSSNVNVMTTKAPPSFHVVIHSDDVKQLVKYSNLLGTEHINLRSLVDKAAISTIDMHLSARGTLCGFKTPIDYERWIDWDHRRFTEFKTILFGETQTKLEKSNDLHSGIIKFDFGFRGWTRLGDIRDTVKEQRVLSELSQLIDNDINPEHKTEAGMQELVKLIHRNLTPSNPIMLDMNRVRPPAKTPRDFYVNFLTVRAENRTAWHVANDLGFIKPSAHSAHSTQNNDFSGPSSK
jgi:hypothetical protein